MRCLDAGEIVSRRCWVGCFFCLGDYYISRARADPAFGAICSRTRTAHWWQPPASFSPVSAGGPSEGPGEPDCVFFLEIGASRAWPLIESVNMPGARPEGRAGRQRPSTFVLLKPEGPPNRQAVHRTWH
jgi:hypothetical protein